MSVRRSPVSTPTTAVEHTLSDTDLNTLQLTDVSFVNVKRNKRFRTVQRSPPEIEQNDNHDILELLNTWKTDFQTKLDEMYNRQNKLITQLSAEITELKTQNSKIQKTNDDIAQSMSFINSQYEEIKSSLGLLQKERLDHKRCIENLERRVLDLQLKTRSSSIEIRNIPQAEKETDLDLKNMICEIGQAIGTSISPSDLRDIYRLPGKVGIVRPVVAEFQTVQMKLNTIAAVREYNKNRRSEEKLNTEIIKVPGKRQAVYVSDCLPMSSKKLFYQAREFSKRHNFKYCWTLNGNIYLRKTEGENQILVSSEKTLLDLQNKI